MDYRQLGDSDLNVSAMGMGCVTFGREIDQQTSITVMDSAMDAGINLLDTSENYHDGRSEKTVGRWISERRVRDQVILATKVGLADGAGLTRERIASSAQKSLSRLKTDYVDLYQVHVWDDATPLDETQRGLDDLVQKGLARAVGCSNYTGAQLQMALRSADQSAYARIQSVQPNYNLVARESESDMLPLCQAENVGVITYSPLGAGFLTGKYRKNQPPPTGSRFDIKPGHQAIYFHDRMFEIAESVAAFSTECGISVPHLALGWVFQKSGITSTLVGARSISHIEQALHAPANPLSEDVLNRLNTLSA